MLAVKLILSVVYFVVCPFLKKWIILKIHVWGVAERVCVSAQLKETEQTVEVYKALVVYDNIWLLIITIIVSAGIMITEVTRMSKFACVVCRCNILTSIEKTNIL